MESPGLVAFLVVALIVVGVLAPGWALMILIGMAHSWWGIATVGFWSSWVGALLLSLVVAGGCSVAQSR